MSSYTKTTTNAPQEVVSYDPDRTNLTMTNLSGEICYISVDPNVASSGTDQGEPIFQNGRFEANWSNGRDPRLARFVIGTAGGQLVIGMEWYKADPITEALKGFNAGIQRLIDVINPPKPEIPVIKQGCGAKKGCK